MRVLVTGGSGFIGTNIVEFCHQHSDAVLNFDIVAPRNPEHTRFWLQGDLLSLSSIEDAFKEFEPEVVLHMGARTDLEGSSLEDYSANTIGVENLISAAQASQSTKRIIFASSRLVCRIGYVPSTEDDYCPSTAYGESKVAGERIVRRRMRDSGMAWCIVRPTSIWGPWFRTPYRDFFDNIRRGTYVNPTRRPIAKSFGYVGNVVAQLDFLARADIALASGKTAYLQDHSPIIVQDFADCIAKEFHVGTPKNLPEWALRFVAKFGDSLRHLGIKDFPLTTFRLNNLLENMVFEDGILSRLVPELPYSYQEGVVETVEWIRRHG